LHLSVVEMNITMDDVSCLIYIPIHGKLVNHQAKISQEQCVALLFELLDVDPDFVVVESATI